jgi:hypothetical protein
MTYLFAPCPLASGLAPARRSRPLHRRGRDRRAGRHHRPADRDRAPRPGVESRSATRSASARFGMRRPSWPASPVAGRGRRGPSREEREGLRALRPLDAGQGCHPLSRGHGVIAWVGGANRQAAWPARHAEAGRQVLPVLRPSPHRQGTLRMRAGMRALVTGAGARWAAPWLCGSRSAATTSPSIYNGSREGARRPSAPSRRWAAARWPSKPTCCTWSRPLASFRRPPRRWADRSRCSSTTPRSSNTTTCPPRPGKLGPAHGSNLRAPFLLIQALATQAPDPVQTREASPWPGPRGHMVDQRVRKLTPEFMTYTLAKAGPGR